MKNPLTNTQEILYTLISQGYVSLFDFPYLAGFRTRVSELVNKHGIPLQTIKHQRHNKFGNAYTYHIHKLLDREHAKKVYELLTDKN